MSKRNKIIVLAAIALLISGMAFYPKFKKSSSADKEKNVKQFSSQKGKGGLLNVNAIILKPETLHDVFRTKGVLLPDEEVNLIFEISGKITGIYFSEGSHVEHGQLLAKVNDAPLQAELKKLQSQLPLFQERVTRHNTLLQKDAISKESYEVVNTELEKLKADINLVKVRITQTELRAPFSGIIGLRQVSIGAYASPALVIARLTKISPLKIEFSVNERQANDIKSGTHLKFMPENSLENYSALVYAVESQLDKQTLSMKARARYDNAGRKLKPGQSVSVEVKMREIKNTIVIPSISAIAEMGRDIAYVADKGKARQVELTKGIRTASSVQILKGLSVGDTLITTGVMQLRDGMDVKINEITPYKSN